MFLGAQLITSRLHGDKPLPKQMITQSVDIYHYSDVKMSAMASQITGVSIVYSTTCSSANQRKHQSSASLTFGRGIHLWQVNSPHKGSVTRKMFPFGDDIMMCVNVKWTAGYRTYMFICGRSLIYVPMLYFGRYLACTGRRICREVKWVVKCVSHYESPLLKFMSMTKDVPT